MPWEKSFNEDEVLDKAMQVFWQKGFEPTSINDLLQSTGINRGSLYNAYGGKQALFQKALLKYDTERRRTLLARLEALDNPRQAIRDFFGHIVADTVADKARKGCFLINTAGEIGCHDAQVSEIVSNGLREIEGFFRRSIEVGQVRGQIRKDLDPAATAKSLLSFLVGIRVLGRGTFTEEALRTLASEAGKLID